MASVEFRVLGPLEVIGPGGSIEIGSARQRAILAVLVLHAGETVSNDRLIEEVWGDDPPPGAHHTLGVHVSGLRRAIGPDRVETQPNGYRLRSEGSDSDLQRFEDLVSEASRALNECDPHTAAARFAAALALWRGPALGDLDATAARAERTRLNELRALALERRIDADLACGRHMDVIPELRRIVTEMPLQEAFSARLMLALYRSGRQAEALDVYLHAREVLDRELGVEPGQELEALQRAVLDHDPALSIAPVTGHPRPSTRPADTSTQSDGEPPLVEAAAAALAHEGIESLARHRPPDRPTPSIQPVPRRADTRRTVTILMADVRGSTLSGEPLDPESARHPLDCCFEEMRADLERHGGTVEQVVGDALLAVFGVPLIHEDDALRAVRAALEMRDALAALNDRLERELGVRIEMRVGVNTGEVVASWGSGSATLVTGDAVNMATRLEQAAGPGEILLGDGTYHLVRWAVHAEPAGAIDPRGRPGPIRAFRLLRVTPGVGGRAQRFDSPLVGRERERRLLESAFEQATADETCQLFSLLGPAGVGKSRLVHEFVRCIRREAQILRSRCPPYGERVAFWPVVETIQQAAGICDADSADAVRGKIAALVRGDQQASAIAEHVAAIIRVSEVRSTSEETSWAVRRTFEAIARARPLVIVFDDVQWGEPSFLDLIECLADTSRGAPILLLCIARPELLDERPGWGGGKLNSTSVLLTPLAAADVSKLVRNLLGGSGAPRDVERKIIEAAEGNPLFVEEFLAMLLDDEVILRAGDEWVATSDLAAITTPASIMALLAARLDRLSDDEREILERAAVVGKVFTREAVEALVEHETMPDVVRRFGTLVHKELIRPDRPSPDSPDSYRFKHMLIRDAAYAGLSKSERAELHERFADFQERAAGHRLTEYEEIIGYHLEQAIYYRRQLGLDDERTRELARRAAQLLGAAGVRALQRGDALASSRLLERCRVMWKHSKRGGLLRSRQGDG